MDGWQTFFDGNWFDVLTLAGGAVYAVLNRRRLPDPKPWLSAKTGLDIFNGSAVVPLLFMAASAVSTKAVTALLEFNRLTLSLAALVALFAVLQTA